MTRPDLLVTGKDQLNLVERSLIRFVRGTFDPGLVDWTLRSLGRFPAASWIHLCTKNLLYLAGRDRLPIFDRQESYICVANHRSFFDLFVVASHLIRGCGLKNRVIFPVRSSFFYSSPAGLFVNGAMSFFSMYPPIFREREKSHLNATSMSELAWLINRGGVFVGYHPEGTRNKGDDPYEFLQPKRGVGQLIHATNAKVIPVFINGLRLDGLARQVASNFDGTGVPITVVFGEPVALDDLRTEPSSQEVHMAIAERAMDAIRMLSEEERMLREKLSPS